jgi:YidC/Oxa1 family membrane protein insertase
MLSIWNTIIHDPLLNGLIFLYNTVAFHNLGIAIILLTTLIRFILYPIFRKSARHQRVMQELQPKLKKIQDDHKSDRVKQGEAMMALYKEHNINPMSGFLLLLVQLPILIALYSIFRNLDPQSFTGLYSFVHAPETLNYVFGGLINLSERSIVGGNLIVLILAAVAQFYQAKLTIPPKKEGDVPTQAEKLGQKMVLIGPVITVVVLWQMPTAVSLYWLTTSIFSIIQQVIVNKEHDERTKLGNIYQKGS